MAFIWPAFGPWSGKQERSTQVPSFHAACGPDHHSTRATCGPDLWRQFVAIWEECPCTAQLYLPASSLLTDCSRSWLFPSLLSVNVCEFLYQMNVSLSVRAHLLLHVRRTESPSVTLSGDSTWRSEHNTSCDNSQWFDASLGVAWFDSQSHSRTFAVLLSCHFGYMGVLKCLISQRTIPIFSQ